MLGALAGLAFVLGVALGWLAHRAVSIHYRQRWLELVGLMNAKALEPDPDPQQLAVHQAQTAVLNQTPYVHGRWALDQRARGDRIEFFAVRLGFDDVPLGSVKATYGGVVKMTRTNAQEAVDGMNAKP